MKKIRYLIFLSMLFTLLMCGSVFALDYSSVPHTVTITGTTYTCDAEHSVASITNNSSNFMFGLPGSGLLSINKGYVVKGNVTVNGQIYECFVGFGFSPVDWHSDTTGTSLTVAQQLLTDYFAYTPSESFDPSAGSTLEGFNELGFVGGWGSNSLIYTDLDTTNFSSDDGVYGHGYKGSYSGVQENTFSFQSFDAPVQNGSKAVFRKNLNPSDYDELFIQVSFMGASAMRCFDRESSISLPTTNDRLYFPTTINYFNGNSSVKYSNGDILPLISGTKLLSALSYNHRTWYNDFTLGARFVALKDGHYIYGPWTDDKFVIDGDKINTVPEYPENTINKTKHTVQYNTPTDSPDVDIVVNTKTDEIPVYYPKIKINEGDVNVEVSIPDINNNLAQAGVNTPSVGIDAGTLQTETQGLIDMVNSVPSALAGLFSFLPAWVLGLFAVVFGILLLIRILK